MAVAVWYFAADCIPESGVVFCRMMEKKMTYFTFGGVVFCRINGEFSRMAMWSFCRCLWNFIRYLRNIRKETGGDFPRVPAGCEGGVGRFV